MASALWFSQAIAGQWSATAARRVDWVGDTIVVSLHTSGYTPDQDTHDFFNDTNNEVSGGNYARQTLGTKSVNYDASSNSIQLRAAQTTFANLSATFRWIVIWKDTGSTATSPLLGYVDAGAQSVAATNFVVTWNATDGVLKGVTS
jgi:hypothetical protein